MLMLLKNMKLDQSVCLILGATLAVKTNRRLTVTCQSYMIYLSIPRDPTKARTNEMAPLQAEGL